MALRRIIENGDPILRKKCRPIGEVNERTRILLDDLVDTMREAQGIGLAAPQVGVMRRAFVIEPGEGRLMEFVDPEILEEEGEQTLSEGCLSLPGLIGDVTRPAKIKVRGRDRDNEVVETELEGLDAVAFCHENDHLDGILYIDKASNVRASGTEEEDQQ